jgi:exodeoxyribonuclease VII large subunit
MAVPVREEWLATVIENGRQQMLAMKRILQQRTEAVTGLARGLPQPAQLLEMAAQKLDDRAERLHGALPALLTRRGQQLQVAVAKLQPRSLLANVERQIKDVVNMSERAGRMMLRVVDDKKKKLDALTQVMQSLNPTRVLERGFALVLGEDGKLITRAGGIKSGELTIQFADGVKKVRA